MYEVFRKTGKDFFCKALVHKKSVKLPPLPPPLLAPDINPYPSLNTLLSPPIY